MSVFYGFCEDHDRETFSPIENDKFVATREQLFLHCYRSVARESYLKRIEYESIPSDESLKQLGADSSSMPIYGMLRKATLIGAVNIETIKKRLDNILLSEDYISLNHKVIQFKDQLPFCCNFTYFPDYDFNGIEIQPFEDEFTPLEFISVTLIPSDLGSFVIFSVEEKGKPILESLLDSLEEKCTYSSVFWLILCCSENFAISPEWHEALSPKEKDNLLGGFMKNVNKLNSEFNILRNNPFDFESKEVQNRFWL